MTTATLPRLSPESFSRFKEGLDKQHRAVMGETYGDVQRLLFNIVHKFIAQVVKRKRFITRREYDAYFEEAMDEANIAFMDAQLSFDPSKKGFQGRPAAFTTWLQNIVRFRLLDWWNAVVVNSERYRTNMAEGHRRDEADWFEGVQDEAADDADGATEEKKRFDQESFLGRLSADAQAVAKLVLEDLDKPIEWEWLFGEWKEQTGLPDRTYCKRKAVKQRLLDWGWASERIAETWREIKEVLGCDSPVTRSCRRCGCETANAGRACTKCLAD